jgi:hypothetical protein
MLELVENITKAVTPRFKRRFVHHSPERFFITSGFVRSAGRVLSG